MKSQLRVILSALTLSLAAPAFAGDISFLAEPYAGWTVGGKQSLEVLGTGVDMMNFNGFTFGARAGAEFSSLIFGALDFTYAPSMSYSTVAALSTLITSAGLDDVSGSGKATRFGIVVGIMVPNLPIRAWLGYNPIDRLSDADTTLKGSSFKIGVGVKPIPLLSLNAEYIMTSFSTITQGTTDTEFNSLVGMKAKSFLLTASVPFSLPVN